MSDERSGIGDGANNGGLEPWLALVERLLGPQLGDEPTAKEIVALQSGELAPDRRGDVEAYLDAHPELRAAVRAGLQEARRLEEKATDRATAIPSFSEIRERLAGAFSGVLCFAAPVPCVTAADSEADDHAPVPEDWQVLAEEEGVARLTFYRRGAQAFVTLFNEQPDELAVDRCQLEGVALAEQEAAERASTFALGPAAALSGKKLTLVLIHEGTLYELSWTLVNG